jgi:hypothetical protein
VWSTQKRHRPDGTSYAWLVKTSAMVNHFYFYCVDADFGPFFLKFCSYFPFNAKLCINGQYAERPAMPHEAETRLVTLGSRFREAAFLVGFGVMIWWPAHRCGCPSPTSMEQERS